MAKRTTPKADTAKVPEAAHRAVRMLQSIGSPFNPPPPGGTITLPKAVAEEWVRLGYAEFVEDA